MVPEGCDERAEERFEVRVEKVGLFLILVELRYNLLVSTCVGGCWSPSPGQAYN